MGIDVEGPKEMKMAVFNNCQIALDLGMNVGFKKKVEVRKTIIEYGGIVSYIVTKKVSKLVVFFLLKFKFNAQGIPVWGVKDWVFNPELS